MLKHKQFGLLISAGGVLLLMWAVLFWPTTTASAQCGSQASSCKNCHEVQAEYPVNNDGTEWHQPHAFGDFCEFCHAGNVQSTVKAEAHTGMVDPLADAEASCSSCHEDYLARAEGYASTLGVELAAAPDTPVEEPVADAAADDVNPEPQPVNLAMTTEMVVPEEDLVDFNKQYEETVLGIRDLNVGNVILAALALLLLAGGALFVTLNEGWVTVTAGKVPQSVDGYSKDAVMMLSGIEKLNQSARKALAKLLKKPAKAGKIFKALADVDEKEES